MKCSNINVLQKEVDELGLDLQAIAEEHDRYCMASNTTEDEAINWLHSLPIETLSDSIKKDRQLPRTKYSLHDMRHKAEFRRMHEKKREELELAKIKLNIAKIDAVIEIIEKIG